jgi:hypothetical protein
MSNYQQHPIHPPAGNQPPWPPQGQPGPLPPQPPIKPTQGGTWWKSRPIIGGAALLLGVGIGAAGGNGNTTSDAAAGSTPTVTVSVPADGGAPAAAVTVTAPPPAAKTVQVPGPVKTVTAPPPAPAAAIADDGIWLVGTDVKPGTYRSSSGGDCYWARLKNTSGDFDGIITNGTGANQVVTVKKTDKAFESTRCAPWTRIR